MNNYDKHLDELVERSLEKRDMPLYDLIMSEHLDRYEPGFVDILYADPLNNAIVPCRNFMILARDRYDANEHKIVAEYAIYSQHDRDGSNLRNSMNANAVYHLEMVGEETFENMAFAIAYAADLIRTMTDNDKEE